MWSCRRNSSFLLWMGAVLAGSTAGFAADTAAAQQNIRNPGAAAWHLLRIGLQSTASCGNGAGNWVPTPKQGEPVRSFKHGDLTIFAMSCMRSGTRVFCDYDETKDDVANVAARGIFDHVRIVLANGRTAGVSDAYYVDTDGNTFKAASLNPWNPVSLMLVYDNIPAQYTSVSLQFDDTVYRNIPLTGISLFADDTPRRTCGRQDGIIY